MAETRRSERGNKESKGAMRGRMEVKEMLKGSPNRAGAWMDMKGKAKARKIHGRRWGSGGADWQK